MPFVHVQTSVPVSEPAREELLVAVSRLAAKAIGKPESYVMTGLSQGPMLMGGKPGPAAFCEVRSIGGLGPEVCTALSSQLCALLEEKLGVTPERVFLNFVEVEAERWGWNKATFG
ncbi:MAG: hypothetical protein HY901_21955 [Deltaproteobacteria bacterium]|nr:hypothetical protein [Deltaproteobacteria bacterium]